MPTDSEKPRVSGVGALHGHCRGAERAVPGNQVWQPSDRCRSRGWPQHGRFFVMRGGPWRRPAPGCGRRACGVATRAAVAALPHHGLISRGRARKRTRCCKTPCLHPLASRCHAAIRRSAYVSPNVRRHDAAAPRVRRGAVADVLRLEHLFVRTDPWPTSTRPSRRCRARTARCCDRGRSPTTTFEATKSAYVDTAHRTATRTKVNVVA